MTAATPTGRHPQLRPGRYRLDPDATRISFTTRHLFGLAGVTGSFRLLDGHAEVPTAPDPITATARIASASFHTDSPRRDRDVRGARFLDTDRHPTIDLTVDRLEPTTAAEALIATGTLTAHGITAPLIAQADRLDRVGDVLRLRLTTTIDRTTHGITAARGMAARHLTVTVDLVAAAE